MGMLARVRAAAEAFRQPSLESRVQEAVTRQLRELSDPFGMGGAGNDPDRNHTDFSYYSRIRKGPTRRDLPADLAERIRSRVLGMRVQNPLAATYLRLMRQLTTQGEYRIVAQDPQVQELLDEFYAGSYNDWPGSLPSYSDGLAATGRLCLPVHVAADGYVRVSYADSSDVTEVETLDNVRIPRRCKWGKTRIGIVHPVLDRGSDHYGRLTFARTKDHRRRGMLYFRINHLANDGDGLSDLSSAVDPLIGHEEYLTGSLEQATVLGRVVADVTVKKAGASDPDVQAVANRYEAIPGYASVNVHTDAEEVKFGAAPSMAAEAADRDRMHGNYATAALVFPPHILRGDMGEGNRAIAATANDPANLHVSNRTAELARIIKYSCRFAVDQAVMAGQLSVSDESFEVQAPQVLKKDLSTGATTLKTVTEALAMAVDRRWVPDSVAQAAFVRLLPEIGYESATVEEVRAELGADTPTEQPEQVTEVVAALREVL